MATPKNSAVMTKAPIVGGATLTKTSAPIKKYTPAPSASNLASYNDAAYQAQLAALQKAQANYAAQMQLQKDRIGIDFGEADRDLGRQRDRDLNNIKEDYAARGVVRSGLYGKRNDDYNTEYNNQLGDLARARDRGIQDLDVGFNNFNSEYSLNNAAAVDAAVQRRLQQIKAGQYTTAKPKTATLSGAPSNSIAGFSV